jgi:hypothetical protein
VDLFERFFNKDSRFGALPSWVRRREKPADVPRSNRAQQSVSQGMQQNIAIRMAGQALIVDKFHPANLERNAGAKFMGIPTVTNSHAS